MRWKNLRQSRNVQDRRASTGGGGKKLLGGGIGTFVVLAILSLVFKTDLTQLAGGGLPTQGEPAALTEESNQQAAFVSRVFGSTEDVWVEVFKKYGKEYRPAKLINYRGHIAFQSVNGAADSATGPFYLPVEETVYIDTSFFDQMESQFGAGGDFAFAYVVAHEVGHHVQKLLGFTDKVHSKRGRISDKEYNQLSVRLELQADFLAGVWAHHADESMMLASGKSLLEEGDIEEAMRAANAIGDDALQRQARGEVVPDSFTHGTSKQRMRWFMKGFKSGDLNEGDTFSLGYEQL